MVLDERGKQCPLPVIEAKKALEQTGGKEVVEVRVDNEIAVQNLKKLADRKGMSFASEKRGEQDFLVRIIPKGSGGNGAAADERGILLAGGRSGNGALDEMGMSGKGLSTGEDLPGNGVTNGVAELDLTIHSVGMASVMQEGLLEQEDSRRTGLVVVLSSDRMGQGADELGKILMKGFVYALSQQDRLPETILLYNGGARLSCEGSEALEDLKILEAEGVEILTCGTCLNYYGLSEKLGVGSVTNMYEIAERLTGAITIVKP